MVESSICLVYLNFVLNFTKIYFWHPYLELRQTSLNLVWYIPNFAWNTHQILLLDQGKIWWVDLIGFLALYLSKAPLNRLGVWNENWSVFGSKLKLFCFQIHFYLRSIKNFENLILLPLIWTKANTWIRR